MMNVFLCLLMGYLAGCLNPSYLIARCKGFDIRSRGSGNAGASNAVITMGKAVGLFSALFDILKAFLITRAAMALFPSFALAFPLSGTACILGHIFPFYMHFRGGKGLACLGGVLLSYSPLAFLLVLAGELVLALLTDYICLVPLTGCLIFTGLYAWGTHNWAGICIFLIADIAIFFRHLENLRRIRCGTEMRLSYLWRKDEELARIQKAPEEGDEEK